MVHRVLILLLAGLSLAGCTMKAARNHGSAPYGKINRSQKPYVIYGIRYEPLQDHQGFSQEGRASWYGKDFHGKATSSGERYNMHAFTAAHKTLPLGVFVRVQNKSNGKETVVRVNDRGPFVSGRIIDLSYAAAKEIDMVGAGTAPVAIEAIGYTPGTEKGAPDLDAGSYTIQAGSFSIYENAAKASAELKGEFGHSRIRDVKVEGTPYYRVYAGKFKSLRQARQAQEKMEGQGYRDSFVVASEE